MIDRKLAPATEPVTTVALPAVEKLTLDNGMPVYAIHAGEQEVLKIEWLYDAGRWFEPQKLVADITNRMLREGTRHHSAHQLAEAFDFFGSSFSTSSGNDFGSLSLHTLTKHAEAQLPLIRELLTESVFPEQELQTILANRKQKLAVEMEKNEFVCNRQFVQALFGDAHPYGRVSHPADFDAIQPEALRAFCEQHYHSANGFIILSGRFSPALLRSLNTFFGTADLKKATPAGRDFAPQPQTEKVVHADKANSVQSAVQVGGHTIPKRHPDFYKLSIANMVLGGYFGSRLMSNIREEKGYTYGIASYLAAYRHHNFIEISTEVGKEVREATLREIENEVIRLCNEPAGEEELTLVRNYMMGKILRSVDGPMRFSDTLRNLLIHGQDESAISVLIDEVKSATPETVQQTAQRYFIFGEMYRITVG